MAVAGGVSANNGLANFFREHAEKYGWNIFIPKFSYTTDNAAMIAITGYFKYLDKDFCPMEAPAFHVSLYKEKVYCIYIIRYEDGREGRGTAEKQKNFLPFHR